MRKKNISQAIESKGLFNNCNSKGKPPHAFKGNLYSGKLDGIQCGPHSENVSDQAVMLIQ